MNKKLFAKLFAIVLAACVIFSLAVIVGSAAEASGTISFATTDHRVSQDSNSQVWQNEEITFTNDKASSSTNVGDYSNPVRIYAGSTVTIEAPGNITSIVITSNGTTKYKTALENSVTGAGATYTVSDNVYTITPATTSASFTMSMTAQARFVDLTVNYEAAGSSTPEDPDCEHANTTTTTVDATCTEDGSTTVTCDDCGYEVSKETITAPGHIGGEATCEQLAICDECGEEYGSYAAHVGGEATCEDLAICDVCSEAYGDYAAHDFVDGSCTVCGEAEPTEATITFDDTSKKDSTVTTGMLWKENGIEVFVSSSNTYSNPLRCYKNSTVTITGTTNIAKIVFNANTTAYATTLKDTIGETAIADEKAVTVNLDGTSNTYEVTMSVGQVRIDSITVYYVNANAPVCKHTETETVTENATCHTAGSVTEVCVDCGTPVSSETIPAAHTFANGVCSVCSMVEAPKAGVPYKFGMYQGNKGATYYIDGAVNGYYMNTVTDASAGITVYLEETDGGYYMYSFIEGVKTYIDMVVSGTYVNAVYVTTASTVYTIDETKNTVCATVGDDTRYFGTSNTGTYTTVGTTYSSGFVCQFYATGDVAKFNSASVTLGTDLGMIFKATVPAGVPTLTVEFNGKTYELTADAAGTVYSFNFKGIGPHQLALNIKATLKVDGVAVAEINNYSVEKNLNAIKSAEGASAALIELVNSVLIYGSESEKYLGIEEGVNADELTNDVAENDATYTFENADTFGFTAVGVNFDAANRIYVKFFVKGDFTLTVNGTEVAVEATEDGYYKVYTDALNAKQFDEEFTFVITVGEETATLTYSVNAYAAAMKDDAEMGALAEALYAYGVKAKAYVG